MYQLHHKDCFITILCTYRLVLYHMISACSMAFKFQHGLPFLLRSIAAQLKRGSVVGYDKAHVEPGERGGSMWVRWEEFNANFRIFIGSLKYDQVTSPDLMIGEFVHCLKVDAFFRCSIEWMPCMMGAPNRPCLLENQMNSWDLNKKTASHA